MRTDVPVLRCCGLTRRFGARVAVDDVSFAVAAGETYGLLGPNGSGKTTTISMIAGILRPDAGTVEVAGRPMSPGAGAVKRLVGLVPQDLALYDDLSAVENLRFFGRLQGLGGAALAARIAHVLDVVGLTDRGRDRVGDYSGGMKRRANIAVGLLHEPQLLILDEPTVGVDPQSRRQILESIEELGRSGLAVLYTTHYMEEAERLCDRVAIIDHGHMIAEGTRAELVARVGELDVVTVQLAGEAGARQAFAQAVRGLDGVVAVRVEDGADRIDAGDASGGSYAPSASGTVTVQCPRADRVLARLVDAAATSGCIVSSLVVREPNLESVFLDLTGRALRD